MPLLHDVPDDEPQEDTPGSPTKAGERPPEPKLWTVGADLPPPVEEEDEGPSPLDFLRAAVKFHWLAQKAKERPADPPDESGPGST